MTSAGKSFIGVILSALLCIMMFIFTCVFTALLLLRAGNIATIIRNTDISEIIGETDIAYYLVHQLNSLPFNDAQISLSDVEGFIKTDAVSEEIGNIFSDFASALNNGDFEYHLTTDNVLGIVKNLEPELQDLFDHRMTETDNIILARTLDDILDFQGLTVGGIIYDFGIDTFVPRLLLSPYLLWGTGILIVLTLCFIILLNIRKIHNAFLQSGIPVALSGFAYLITGLVLDAYSGMSGGTLQNLSRLVAGVIPLVIRYGTVLTVTGAASIAVYLILRARKQR